MAEGIEIPPGYRKFPERLNIAAEVLDRQVEEGLGGRPALHHQGGILTFAELRDRVDRLAGGLLGLGVARGTPVLLRMPSSPEFGTAFLALQKIGALPVLVNSLLGREELLYIIEHSEARGAISLSPVASALRDIQKKKPFDLLVVARGAETGEVAFEFLLEKGEGPLRVASTRADEPAFLVYTSGTTGRPKGILHAHRWVVAVGDSNLLRLPLSADDVVLATGELSFISPLGHGLLFPLRRGASAALLEGRPSPENVLEAIERHRVTILYSVPTVYRRILATKGIERRYDLTSLRWANAGSEALGEAVYREWRARFGCELFEHYGVSEFQLVFGNGPSFPVRPGAMGKAIPGVEVAILDEELQPLGSGEVGHLMIRADDPGIFLGYHKDKARSEAACRGGWFRTGDLAYQDADGYFWMAGRTDECFKSRGYFISPQEIENALQGHPAVLEAAVVPESDPEIGHRIRAVVVTRSGYSPSPHLAEEIRKNLKGRIAPFKVPHAIEFAEALPRSPVGKLLRRLLIRPKGSNQSA